jgi:hypothetical protein
LAVLHLSEADYGVILSPSRTLYETWVTGHIVSHFGLSNPEVNSAPGALLEVTKWLLQEANGQGVRDSNLELHRVGPLTEMAVGGRWGRGRKTLIRAGKVKGERFYREWIAVGE